MTYKARTLFRIIEDIGTHALLLPHIQRPFVWDRPQMVRLFDSLMRGYPVQTLLFWRTKENIKARRFMEVIDLNRDLSDLYDKQRSQAGIEKVFVLDGQQRIQTLFAIFNGGVAGDAAGSTEEAYLDVSKAGTSENDDGIAFEIVFSPKPLPLPHYRIRDLISRDAPLDSTEIGNRISDALPSLPTDEHRARERRIFTNVNKIKALLREERDFWIEELDGVANSQQYEYKKVLEIFVRVNSGGTKLTASDLMFASLKEGWDEIEEKIEQTVNLLNLDNGRLCFEATFPLKCLMSVHGAGANLGNQDAFIGESGRTLLKACRDGWDKAETAFRELRDFIKSDLHLYSDKVIHSYSAFVPLFEYLYLHPKPDEASRVVMRAYHYKAQMLKWFGSSGDAVIDAIHRIVTDSSGGRFPISETMSYFRVRGRHVELSESQINESHMRPILLNMIYVDQLGNSPFDVCFKGNDPQIDHVYPRAKLSKLAIAPHEINDIGNFRYVGSTDNNRKRAELPDSYFLRLKSSQVDILRHLLVERYAADPAELKDTTDAYKEFRQLRRQRIWEISNRIVNMVSPITQPAASV